MPANPFSSLPAQAPAPLSEHTTLRLGGSPQAWCTAHTLEQLALALNQYACGPVLILGGGSNVVCADAPFPGAVIEIALQGVYLSPTPSNDKLAALTAPNLTLDAASATELVPSGIDYVWLHVAAGETWDNVVAAACRWGFAGLECLSGIPGKAGATPIQNVGAYGQEVSDTLWSVTCLNRQTQALAYFTAAECDLRYRNSRFKDAERDQYVVVEVVFRLRVGGSSSLRYGELSRQFEGTHASPSLGQIRAAVLSTRAAKSMVLDPADPNGRNCGSFFLNPIVRRSELLRLQAIVAESVPHFDVDSERVKVPAAWLIERAGFARGHQHGNVGLSTKHTLCLVAHDAATAAELLDFARHIRDQVRLKFDIELQPEPVLVGHSW